MRLTVGIVRVCIYPDRRVHRLEGGSGGGGGDNLTPASHDSHVTRTLLLARGTVIRDDFPTRIITLSKKASSYGGGGGTANAAASAAFVAAAALFSCFHYC